MSNVAKRDERGAVTAEYSVLMLAGISIGGILLRIISDPKFQELLWKVLQTILNVILSYIGQK